MTLQITVMHRTEVVEVKVLDTETNSTSRATYLPGVPPKRYIDLIQIAVDFAIENHYALFPRVNP